MTENKYFPLAEYGVINCSKGRHDFRDESEVKNLSIIKEDKIISLSTSTLFQLGEVECGSCHRILRVYTFSDILKTPQRIPAPFLMNWYPLTQEILDRFNSLPEAKP